VVVVVAKVPHPLVLSLYLAAYYMTTLEAAVSHLARMPLPPEVEAKGSQEDSDEEGEEGQEEEAGELVGGLSTKYSCQEKE